jgi:translation initiation factor IF-1
MFRVLLDGETDTMIAYLSGKMRRFKIKVLIGDRVEVLKDPYGGKGRITRRL